MTTCSWCILDFNDSEKWRAKTIQKKESKSGLDEEKWEKMKDIEKNNLKGNVRKAEAEKLMTTKKNIRQNKQTNKKKRAQKH